MHGLTRRGTSLSGRLSSHLPHCFLWLVILAVAAALVLALASSQSAVADEGTLTDIGTLTGDANSAALDINENDLVVGSSESAGGEGHAFVYDKGNPGAGMTDLGSLGGDNSTAYGINDSNQIVGSSENVDGDERAFLYEGGAMADIGTLGGDQASASAINNSGQIAGWSELGTGIIGEPGVAPGATSVPSRYVGTASTHAFRYEGGTMTDIPTLGGLSAIGLDINANGWVVGVSNLTGNTSQHAFLWKGSGTPIDLGTLGGNDSTANAINDSAEVVGWAKTASGNAYAFYWTEAGGMTNLGTLGGTDSSANDISNAGVIVGNSRITGDTSYHAFRYANGVMVDLGTLGGAGAAAYATNEKGQIVGTSDITGNTVTHAFVWEPPASESTPAPATSGTTASELAASDQTAVTSLPFTGTQKMPSAITGIALILTGLATVFATHAFRRRTSLFPLRA